MKLISFILGSMFYPSVAGLVFASDLTDALSHQQAQTLTTIQLKETFPGSEMEGINSYGSRYRYTIAPDGTMTGVSNSRYGIFHDIGWWEIKDNLWCRRWELWVQAKQLCFHVIKKGDDVTWYTPDGEFYIAGKIRPASAETQEEGN